MVYINYLQAVISRKHERLAKMIMCFKPDVKILGRDNHSQQAGETNAANIFVRDFLSSLHKKNKTNQVTGTDPVRFSELAMHCRVVNNTIYVQAPQKDKHPLQN